MESNGQPTTQPETLSNEQEEQLLDQLLQQQHVSKAEFNIVPAGQRLSAQDRRARR